LSRDLGARRARPDAEVHARADRDPPRLGRYIEAALYFAETLKLEERLLDLVEELGAEDMVIVNPLSAVISSLPGFVLEDDLEPVPGLEAPSLTAVPERTQAARC
jgi:hypothetical protein